MSWATIIGWGKTALGFTSGIKIWLIAGAAAAAVVVFLWVDNGRLAAERDLARRDAADVQAILEAWQQDAALAYRLVTERDAKISALEGKTRDLIAKIRATPVTRACASSPAIGALLDGLRDDGTAETR